MGNASRGFGLSCPDQRAFPRATLITLPSPPPPPLPSRPPPLRAAPRAFPCSASATLADARHADSADAAHAHMGGGRR